MPTDYAEKVRSESPCSAGFGRGAGRATYVMYYNSSVLANAILDLLGYVKRDKSSGRLIRGLPAAHPIFPWLLCTRIATIRGIGQTELRASTGSTEGHQLAFYAQYGDWELTCEFEHLPYAALPDTAISTRDFKWVRDDGTGDAPMDPFSKYATEWERFTSPNELPSSQVLTANQGQQVFRSHAIPPGGGPYPGAPRIGVMSSKFDLTWHFVPYAFVTEAKSAIRQYQGRVNQTTFFGFAPGLLRYDSITVNRYLPPVPDFSIQPGGIAFSHDFVADITFHFEACNRFAEDPVTPTNGNWMVNGWNSRYWWKTGLAYYCTAADTDPAKWRPAYLSFPPELLFTDPAVL